MLTAADTAYTIAHIRALEARRPAGERLFDDPYAPIFDAAGDHAREGTARFLALPFLPESVRVRTRFIDDAVRDALASGVDQLVLLGAGFDARGLRLAGEATRVFEVDFAHVLATKRALLEGAKVALPSRVSYVPSDFLAADFDARLVVDLEAAGFRREARAVVVWEGVIGYIDDVTIDRTLRFVAGLAGPARPGTRLVFTHADPKATGGGEPMDARAARAGLTMIEDATFGDLWRRYCASEPHESSWVGRVGVAST